MDKNQFWKSIDSACEVSGGGKGMYEPLLKTLSAMEPQDVIHWQQIFDEYMELADKQKLWGAAAVMHHGCSDDGFMDFRGWLIAQGKNVYLNALSNPDSLAGVKSVRAFGREVLKLDYYMPLKGYSTAAKFEKILSVANYAYENITGSHEDFYDKIEGFPLPDEEKADIAADVKYAPDIDEKWFDWNVPDADIENRLRQAHPNLYRLFNKTDTPAIDTSMGAVRKPCEKEFRSKQIRQQRKTKKKSHNSSERSK